MNAFQAIQGGESSRRIFSDRIYDRGPPAPAIFSSPDIPVRSGAFKIIDSGIGLDAANWNSFNTAFFAAQAITRRGKGLGRFHVAERHSAHATIVMYIQSSGDGVPLPIHCTFGWIL
jgi:hypothetical protein